MKIERGAYVKIPDEGNTPSLIKLVSGSFELLGADCHNDMYSMSDNEEQIPWYAGSTINRPYTFVQWEPLCGAVEFFYKVPSDEDHRNYEVSIIDLVKAVEEVINLKYNI